LDTDQLWYTDSEGEEFQQRRLNWRPWKENLTEPVAGNYYPMNAAAYISDLTQQTQFSVVTGQSRGCSSLNNGQFENMIYRRLLVDDGRGVGEPLNESMPIRNTELVIFDSIYNSSSVLRTHMLEHNNPPIITFSTASSISAWTDSFATGFAPMAAVLPPNVHMLNFRTTEDGRVLLRLHHIFAADEDVKYSQPVQVDLDDLFINLEIVTVTEMTLSSNRPINELHRLVWNTASNEEAPFDFKPMDEDHVITIYPMDIRTFLVRYQNLN